MIQDDLIPNQHGFPSAAYPRYPEFVPAAMPKRIQVNKRTHRIRFEGETENTVIVAIEPIEDQGVSSGQ